MMSVGRWAALAVASAVTVLASWWALAAGSGAAVKAIPYRGRVELNGAPVSGTMTMVFHVWDDATAGTEVFTQTFPSVGVVAGEFAVVLSGTIPDAAYNAQALHVAVDVGACSAPGNCATPQPLQGRQQLFAAAQAIRAQEALNFTVRQDLTVNGVVNTAKVNVTPTQVGGGGWLIAQDFVGVPYAALRLPSSPGFNPNGGIQVGLHNDGHFYVTHGDTGATLASVDRSGNLAATASIAVRNTPAITAIQTGEFCAGTVSGTVTFPVAFPSQPRVVASPRDTNGNGCTSVRTISVTTGAFTWESFVGGALTACECITWMAFSH